MMNSTTRHNFTSRERLRQALLTRIEMIILDAIEKRGKAVLALSGGSTPKSLFQALSHSKLPWQKVIITLVDERWVDVQDGDSNEYLVRSTLMDSYASKANFIGMKNGFESAHEGVMACRQELDIIDEVSIDIVLLGMGEDGHTASFFPEADDLDTALTSRKSCVAITPPYAKHERMTLTLERLFRSEHIFLHIEGENKFKVFNRACEEGSIEAMPIRAFIQRELSPYLEVYYAK